jgi:hypothetical protein
VIDEFDAIGEPQTSAIGDEGRNPRPFEISSETDQSRFLRHPDARSNQQA